MEGAAAAVYHDGEMQNGPARDVAHAVDPPPRAPANGRPGSPFGTRRYYMCFVVKLHYVIVLCGTERVRTINHPAKGPAPPGSILFSVPVGVHATKKTGK